MDLHNKKIGIWGFGISGKAAYAYLCNQNIPCSILNSTEVNDSDVIRDNSANRKHFLESHDIILPSPGIDLRGYEKYSHKFVPEIDLFHANYTKPIVGITGTLGKTSITHYLTTLLNNAGVRAAAGGNIGTGMMDLLSHDSDCAILELSSFQLEYSKTFAPDLAIWTNFHPNHLDRHGTEHSYFEAKKNILAHQTNTQQALVPFELADQLRTTSPNRIFFAQYKPKSTVPEDVIYYFDDSGNIVKNGALILPNSHVPTTSFKTNWLIIAATLDMLGHDPQKVIVNTDTIQLPGSRLEKIATINGVTYYNDSKSTLMQATLAAVESLKNKPTILILGGTSKGVDRSNDIKLLSNKVVRTICFGAEAEQLSKTCKVNGITTEEHETLETAIKSAYKKAPPGAIVLLSPGGASFDLFKNYHERGEKFKELVLNLQQS